MWVNGLLNQCNESLTKESSFIINKLVEQTQL